jgi:DNA-binding CsgD family transcriptional regulator
LVVINGQRLFEFSQEAGNAANQNEVWECLKTALADYGVQWVNYAYGTHDDLIVHSNMSPQWLAYYFEHFLMSDFLIEHCSLANHTLYLDGSYFRGEVDIDEKNKDMLDNISYQGSCGGMSIPLSKPNSNVLGTTGIFFGLGEKDTRDVMIRHGQEITLIMHAAHQFLSSKELQVGNEVFSSSHGKFLKKTDVLTGREKDVLRYLAEGLRPERIAEKMELQVVTIHLHIRKARLRLGAATREQAIVTAINQRQLLF